MKRRARPHPDETADQALRRLFARYYAQVIRAEPDAAAGSVEGLHDLRVALRKIRNVALLFRELDPAALGELERNISKVSDRMGVPRDLDVGTALFSEMDADGLLSVLSGSDRRAMQKGLLREKMPLLFATLTSARYRGIKSFVRAYLRSPPPRRRKPKPSPRAMAARQILAVRKLIESRYRRVGSYSCEPAHNLRKVGRRMRYLSEFFAAALGPESVRAGDCITRAQSALGKVHDCDSALELCKQLPTGKGRAAVRQALKDHRADSLHTFKTAWRQYADRRLQRAWQAQLEAAAAP